MYLWNVKINKHNYANDQLTAPNLVNIFLHVTRLNNLAASMMNRFRIMNNSEIMNLLFCK